MNEDTPQEDAPMMALHSAEELRAGIFERWGPTALLIEQSEALRLHPYGDVTASGKDRGVSIGVGRNLRAKGITESEALTLFWGDLEERERELPRYVPEVAEVDEVRRAVLWDMSITLGMRGLQGFRKMRRAIVQQDWLAAAIEMGDSNWWGDVHEERRVRLLVMLLSGKWEDNWDEAEFDLWAVAAGALKTRQDFALIAGLAADADEDLERRRVPRSAALLAFRRYLRSSRPQLEQLS